MYPSLSVENSIRFILFMERKAFISSFHKIMLKNCFNKKGNTWIKINNDITKVISLQKSRYSNNYYINYGYIINGLELCSTNMHIENRLHFDNESKRIHLYNLLNLDNEIDDNKRIQEIELMINEIIFSEMSRINTLNDVKIFLRDSLDRNDIPIRVKQLFSME